MTESNFFPLEAGHENFYVIAVSGGPDSMFLLTKMRLLGYQFVVCHVNYRKRSDSDHDEQVVLEYCRKFNIKLFITYPVTSDSGNFQAVARRQRYQFFFQIANQFATNKIVIAHNFEDSLETYVMQKERNCLVNCWGLEPVTKHGSYLLFRPILSFPKEQIISYLHAHNIAYAIDESNFSPIYRRNVVRAKLWTLTASEKDQVYNAMANDNLNLRKTLVELNLKINTLVEANLLRLTESWLSSSAEIQVRLLYWWINEFSEACFTQKKKSVIQETRKQLLSKKEKITINLNDRFTIRKTKDLAFISENNLWKTKMHKT